MTFEDSETKTEEEEADEAAADQLQQLVHTFCQGAMVERSADAADDDLYMSYANIMARSCGEEEEEGEEEEGEDEDDEEEGEDEEEEDQDEPEEEQGEDEQEEGGGGGGGGGGMKTNTIYLC